MATLTVNIDNQRTERKVKALLDKLGLSYSINAEGPTHNWWENELLVQELDKRSEDLRSGRDKGVSFVEVKKRLLSK